MESAEGIDGSTLWWEDEQDSDEMDKKDECCTLALIDWIGVLGEAKWMHRRMLDDVQI